MRTTKPGHVFLFSALALIGCENAAQPQIEKPRSPVTNTVSTLQPVDAPASFESHSTLAAKMARMEELLNHIDRFLDLPDFQERRVADAIEFHQLLTESRELSPKGLSFQDKPEYRQSIDQTVAISKRLLAAVQANDCEVAREALQQLHQKRQVAHTQFAH